MVCQALSNFTRQRIGKALTYGRRKPSSVGMTALVSGALLLVKSLSGFSRSYR
jgi:hypothetical protein